MLHYNPRHVSSRTTLICRRSYCIITASGIVTLCKRPYSTPVKSGLQSALNRHTIPYTVLCLHTISKNQPPRSRSVRLQKGDMQQVPGICAPLCNTNPLNVSRQRMVVDYSIAFMFFNIFKSQNMADVLYTTILSAFFHSKTVASCSTSSIC
jgi:hypothetical protein